MTNDYILRARNLAWEEEAMGGPCSTSGTPSSRCRCIFPRLPLIVAGQGRPSSRPHWRFCRCTCRCRWSWFPWWGGRRSLRRGGGCRRSCLREERQEMHGVSGWQRVKNGFCCLSNFVCRLGMNVCFCACVYVFICRCECVSLSVNVHECKLPMSVLTYVLCGCYLIL